MMMYVSLSSALNNNNDNNNNVASITKILFIYYLLPLLILLDDDNFFARAALTVKSTQQVFESFPASFGRPWPSYDNNNNADASSSSKISAHLQFIPEPNQKLCYSYNNNNNNNLVDNSNNDLEEERSNNNDPPPVVVVPKDNVSVAILIERGDCTFSKKANNSLFWYPTVKHVIVYDNNPNNKRLEIMNGVSSGDDYDDLGLLFVSHQTGIALLDMIAEQNQTIANEGGIIIEMDGSKPMPQTNIRKAVAIIPKFTGFLSILGSSYIIYNLIGTRSIRNENKMTTTFNRLLLALCISDIVVSFGFFLSTWPLPKDPPLGINKGFYEYTFPGAKGSIGTCSAQGFFIQLGQMASVLFTGFIALQFVLIVRYKWTEAQMRNVEKYFFAIGTLLPLATSLFLVSVGAMNPIITGFCWIQNDLWNCDGGNGAANPTFCDEHVTRRGENWFIYRLTMAAMWIVLVLIGVIVSMILLFLTVREQELKAARWSDHAQEARSQKIVARTAFLYIGSFLFVWLPTIFAMFVDFLGEGENVIIVTILPLHGLLNSLVYTKRFESMANMIKNSTMLHRLRKSTHRVVQASSDLLSSSFRASFRVLLDRDGTTARSDGKKHFGSSDSGSSFWKSRSRGESTRSRDFLSREMRSGELNSKEFKSVESIEFGGGYTSNLSDSNRSHDIVPRRFSSDDFRLSEINEMSSVASDDTYNPEKATLSAGDINTTSSSSLRVLDKSKRSASSDDLAESFRKTGDILAESIRSLADSFRNREAASTSKTPPRSQEDEFKEKVDSETINSSSTFTNSSRTFKSVPANSETIKTYFLEASEYEIELKD